ncbi:MAG: universal stress protein [Pseudomonadales bacterium]
MSDYRHILIALDFAQARTSVLERALSLAGESTQLSLIHVVEMIIHPDAGTYSVPTELLKESIAHAKQTIKKIGDQYHIAPERQFVQSGRAAAKIHDVAKANNVDLIVVGSHGRHGVQLLLGSTANAVLHGAHCDVLAVRIGKAK